MKFKYRGSDILFYLHTQRAREREKERVRVRVRKREREREKERERKGERERKRDNRFDQVQIANSELFHYSQSANQQGCKIIQREVIRLRETHRLRYAGTF